MSLQRIENSQAPVIVQSQPSCCQRVFLIGAIASCFIALFAAYFLAGHYLPYLTAPIDNFFGKIVNTVWISSVGGTLTIACTICYFISRPKKVIQVPSQGREIQQVATQKVAPKAPPPPPPQPKVKNPAPNNQTRGTASPQKQLLEKIDTQDQLQEDLKNALNRRSQLLKPPKQEESYWADDEEENSATASESKEVLAPAQKNESLPAQVPEEGQSSKASVATTESQSAEQTDAAAKEETASQIIPPVEEQKSETRKSVKDLKALFESPRK